MTGLGEERNEKEMRALQYEESLEIWKGYNMFGDRCLKSCWDGLSLSLVRV